MILQALTQYYGALVEQGRIAPLGWSNEKANFALLLSTEGELLDVVSLSVEETIVSKGGKEKTVEIAQTMYLPERVLKTVGIKSNFLWENVGYILGYDEKGNPERTLRCFAATRDLHVRILEHVDSPVAKAVKGYFEHWEPEKALEHPAVAQNLSKLLTANIVFMVEGYGFAHEDDAVKEAWKKEKERESENAQGICLVTGEKAPIAKVHNLKIKGVPGAQATGATLVGFNAPSFESYGMTQSYNASVGEYAAFAYATALNDLLSSRDYRQIIGDTVVVYWSEQALEMPQKVFSLFMRAPKDESAELNGIMRNVLAGKPVDDVDLSKKFYVLGIAPNAGRVSVRFFLQDNFGDMLRNVSRHYERLEIVAPKFDERPYLSIEAMLMETVNPKSTDKKASPLMAGAVLRSILQGTDYPNALYQAVMLRVRAEHEVTRGKAAILKAYLIKNDKEDIPVALDTTITDRAYVLGRLFAVLEEAQRQANPGINATIKDRYFTSACATPGSVFPQLLKLSAHHTSKAEYGRSSERRIGELMDMLDMRGDPLPTHLSLKEQGVFMVGYYQQRQDFFKKKEDKKDGNSKPV